MELTTIKWSNGKRNNMMEEQAKEELEILEDQYPNQYEFLKQELRTFILELQNSKHQDSELLPQNNHCNTSLALLLDTEGCFTFSLPFLPFFVMITDMDLS